MRYRREEKSKRAEYANDRNQNESVPSDQLRQVEEEERRLRWKQIKACGRPLTRLCVVLMTLVGWCLIQCNRRAEGDYIYRLVVASKVRGRLIKMAIGLVVSSQVNYLRPTCKVVISHSSMHAWAVLASFSVFFYSWADEMTTSCSKARLVWYVKLHGFCSYWLILGKGKGMGARSHRSNLHQMRMRERQHHHLPAARLGITAVPLLFSSKRQTSKGPGSHRVSNRDRAEWWNGSMLDVNATGFFYFDSKSSWGPGPGRHLVSRVVRV